MLGGAAVSRALTVGAVVPEREATEVLEGDLDKHLDRGEQPEEPGRGEPADADQEREVVFVRRPIFQPEHPDLSAAVDPVDRLFEAEDREREVCVDEVGKVCNYS